MPNLVGPTLVVVDPSCFLTKNCCGLASPTPEAVHCNCKSTICGKNKWEKQNWNEKRRWEMKNKNENEIDTDGTADNKSLCAQIAAASAWAKKWCVSFSFLVPAFCLIPAFPSHTDTHTHTHTLTHTHKHTHTPVSRPCDGQERSRSEGLVCSGLCRNSWLQSWIHFLALHYTLN